MKKWIIWVSGLVLVTLGLAWAVKFIRHERNWQAAVARNTVDSYKTFLDSYPDSANARDALRRIEVNAWNSAKDTNTQDAYHNFIADFPQSPETEEARRRSEGFAITVVEIGPAELRGEPHEPLFGVVTKIRPQWSAVAVDARQRSVVAYFKDGTQTELYAMGWLDSRELSLGTSGRVSAMSNFVLKINGKEKKEQMVTFPKDSGWETLGFHENGYAEIAFIFKGEYRNLARLVVFDTLVPVDTIK